MEKKLVDKIKDLCGIDYCNCLVCEEKRKRDEASVPLSYKVANAVSVGSAVSFLGICAYQGYLGQQMTLPPDTTSALQMGLPIVCSASAIIADAAVDQYSDGAVGGVVLVALPVMGLIAYVAGANAKKYFG